MKKNNRKFSVFKDHAEIFLNPKIYPLPVIYNTSYVFIDKAYLILDGDPKKELVVIINPKKKQNIKNLVGDFYNELLNFAVYHAQTEMNKDIKKAIMQRVLLTNQTLNKNVKK